MASGTFDPASSPITGGYQLVKGDASDWRTKRVMGSYTIYEGTGKNEGKFKVKGQGEDTTVSSFREAYDLVQHLIDKKLRHDAAAGEDGWKIHKTFGRFTIYRGTGRYDGKFIVKGEGTNSTVSNYKEAYDLVQQLLKY